MVFIKTFYVLGNSIRHITKHQLSFFGIGIQEFSIQRPLFYSNAPNMQFLEEHQLDTDIIMRVVQVKL